MTKVRVTLKEFQLLTEGLSHFATGIEENLNDPRTDEQDRPGLERDLNIMKALWVRLNDVLTPLLENKRTAPIKSGRKSAR